MPLRVDATMFPSPHLPLLEFACLPEFPLSVSPYRLGDPSVVVPCYHRHSTLRYSALAVVRGVSSRTASRRLRFSFRVLPEATVTTVASRHRFHEVVCPCSVFNSRPGPGVSTVATAFDVSTSLPVWRLQPMPDCSDTRSWGSPFEAFPSHLVLNALTSKTRAVLRTSLSVCPQSLPA
jgi:hypothetical protein